MPETPKKWNILGLIKATESVFKEKNILNARLNAELLLACTLKTSRMELYLDFEKQLSEHELSEFREKVKRRLKHEPLQYITGHTEFYGLQFEINPSVLIPRQETELLVELAIRDAENYAQARILEIGTGSGCVAISIAHNTYSQITAIDTSEASLETAKRNSATNGTDTKIIFTKKDILSDISDFDEFDIIVSNPPYIPLSEMNSLMPEVKDYEPIGALTDCKDGLTFYKKMFELAKNTEHGVELLIEIGDGKHSNIQTLIAEYEFESVDFINDLMNIPRVVHVTTKRS